MPVSDTSSSISYPGNNSTVTQYAVPFYFLSTSDIKVAVLSQNGDETILAENNYTVTGAGNEHGGAVTTANAIPATSTVTIFRQVRLTQHVELPEVGRLPVRAIGDGLDKLTMIAQQHEREVARSIRTSESSVSLDPLLVPEGTANVIFGLNALGNSALLDRTAILAFMNLANASIGTGLKVFTEATKAAAVPDFIGQLGVSYDAAAIGDRIYVSSAMTAGSWTKYVSTIAAGSVVPASLAANVAVTAMWANDAARAALAPSFAGQIGLQLDTHALYYSTGTVAGNWSEVIADGSLALAKLANVTGAGFIGKAGAGAGVPSHLAISGLADQAAPAAGMLFPIQDGNDLKKVDYANLLSTVKTGAGTTTAYTPALTVVSGTNPTMGSGSTATGAYVQIGKLVIGYASIAFGSSGAANGSGTFRISLPVTPASSGPLIGSVNLYDQSADTRRFYNAISSGAFAYFATEGGAVVTQASPWTWANLDTLSLEFSYISQ